MARLGICLGLALAAALSTLPAAAQAPAEEKLTLERAVELALERNSTLVAAAARLRGAEAEAGIARAGRMPRIRVEANVQSTDHPALVFTHKLTQGEFTASDFDVAALNDPDALENWQGRFTVEQPLWTGGRLKHGIAAADAGLDATASEKEATRQQVIYRTVDAWTAAVVASARVELAHSALKSADANLRIVRDLRDAGLVVASDPLQAEVRQAEVLEMLAQAEAGAATAAASLRAVLGGWAGELDLPADLPAPGDSGEPEPGDLAELLAEAERARPELAALEHGRRAAEARARLERASRRPEVALQGFAETDDADFFGASNAHYAIGVGLRFDLFDPSRTSRVARAGARVDEVEARADGLRRQVALDVTSAFHQLRAVEQRLVQTRRAVDLATASLDIVRDRYRNGLALVTELLDSETSLTGARLRRLAAERDLRLARAGLDLAVGRL